MIYRRNTLSSNKITASSEKNDYLDILLEYQDSIIGDGSLYERYPERPVAIVDFYDDSVPELFFIELIDYSWYLNGYSYNSGKWIINTVELGTYAGAGSFEVYARDNMLYTYYSNAAEADGFTYIHLYEYRNGKLEDKGELYYTRIAQWDAEYENVLGYTNVFQRNGADISADEFNRYKPSKEESQLLLDEGYNENSYAEGLSYYTALMELS
ncbi:hypothetical protein FACS1894219_04230 [Clostridia bacterium]|nr:hypothetical protein FACS1894219_04230 [Clostridia bacterium]